MSNKEESSQKMADKFFAFIGKAILIIGTLIFDSFIKGWVLTVMWKWFVIPVFDLPPIKLVYSIGIAMIMGFLTKTVNTAKTESDNKLVALSLLRPFIVLGLGYIIHLFV